MKPSDALERNRNQVLEIIARYPVANPRLFGSAARGEDTETSDLDIVVDTNGLFSYFDMAKLALELEAVLGCHVDIGIARSLRPDVATTALQDMRSL